VEAFKVGDKVKLKSGGPVMTVESISNGNVTCVWFAGSDAKYQAFPPATLEHFAPVRASVPLSVR
jgi:uncharacterized protein YodC (DUF2158 family)